MYKKQQQQLLVQYGVIAPYTPSVKNFPSLPGESDVEDIKAVSFVLRKFLERSRTVKNNQQRFRMLWNVLEYRGPFWVPSCMGMAAQGGSILSKIPCGF